MLDLAHRVFRIASHDQKGRLTDGGLEGRSGLERRRRHTGSGGHPRAGLENAQPQIRERVLRDAGQRLLKRCNSLGSPLLARVQCANGVPGICAALTRIQVAARLEREFAFERCERASFVTAREMEQAAEPVQRDAAEARRSGSLTRLARDPGVELALGLIECLPRDVHGR